MVWAKQTILATGGAGQLYRETTNPAVATADGMALAYRAGAEMRDLEFMQFHPTVLYIAGGSRSLISEAVRGEGAWLVDRHGQRFMLDYDPRGELAPRDVVSLAIVDQMEKTRHPNVFLDLNHLDPVRVHERFPSIAAVCAEFNLDISHDRIPVRPGAHYIMGGISVDIEGRTTVPRLWAAGEVAASGFHGANRLASNSLLEAVFYGTHAGRGASLAAAELRDNFTAMVVENPRADAPTEPLNLADIRNSLQSLMWRNGGRSPGRRKPERGPRHNRTLVPLRAAAAVVHAGGMGTAKHDLRRSVDDPCGAGAGRNSRRTLPRRLSADRRRQLAAAHHHAALTARCVVGLK